VASQFEALEDPAGEPGVIAVDALLPLSAVTDQALRSLRKGKGFNNP
jgi:gluconokinase